VASFAPTRDEIISRNSQGKVCHVSAQETPPSVKVAIALDPSPDAARRFVIDPPSLTRIDHLEGGWRVVTVNQR
jgi:hypothetical protein